MQHNYRTIDGSELPAECADVGFFDIDRQVFAEQYVTLSQIELGTQFLSKKWYSRNPSIYTVFMSGEQVVGYCNTMPVAEEYFESLMAGSLSDGEILPESVCAFLGSDELAIYLCGIAILPAHQNSPAAFLTLLRGVQQKFNRLKALGVRIREVGAIAWSEDGERVASLFGLSRISRIPRLGVVYRGRPNRYFAC